MSRRAVTAVLGGVLVVVGLVALAASGGGGGAGRRRLSEHEALAPENIRKWVGTGNGDVAADPIDGRRSMAHLPVTSYQPAASEAERIEISPQSPDVCLGLQITRELVKPRTIALVARSACRLTSSYCPASELLRNNLLTAAFRHNTATTRRRGRAAARRGDRGSFHRATGALAARRGAPAQGARAQRDRALIRGQHGGRHPPGRVRGPRSLGPPNA